MSTVNKASELARGYPEYRREVLDAGRELYSDWTVHRVADLVERAGNEEPSRALVSELMEACVFLGLELTKQAGETLDEARGRAELARARNEDLREFNNEVHRINNRLHRQILEFGEPEGSA